MAYRQFEFRERNRIALHIAFRTVRWMGWAKNPELILDGINSEESEGGGPFVKVEFKKWAGRKFRYGVLVAFSGNKGMIGVTGDDSEPFECSFTVYPQLSGEPRVSIKGLPKRITPR